MLIPLDFPNNTTAVLSVIVMCELIQQICFFFEEKIKNLQQALSRAQDEIDHIKSTTTNNLNQQFEITKKQYDDEITSLQHRFNGGYKHPLHIVRLVLYSCCARR